LTTDESIKRDVLRLIATEDMESIASCLVGAAFHLHDWRWAQNKFLELMDHADENVVRVATLCLGHLARIHGELDLHRVLPRLHRQKMDRPAIAGTVDDVLEDIAIFILRDS
jgi:hypothetical protein